jgi:hypothetical protein
MAILSENIVKGSPVLWLLLGVLLLLIVKLRPLDSKGWWYTLVEGLLISS